MRRRQARAIPRDSKNQAGELIVEDRILPLVSGDPAQMNDPDCIYIFANASMPGLFKVGVTTMERLKDRARELYTTGVPTPSAHVWHKQTPYALWIEDRIRCCARAERLSRAREFYRADVLTLIRLIERLNREFCRSQQRGIPQLQEAEASTEPAPAVGRPDAEGRYRSWWGWCEVIEGADGQPVVTKRGLRNPVADLRAFSPLPYPVRWIIVDVIGAGHDIDVDLCVPAHRRQHGPWIAGTVLASCLEISSEELLPKTLVEQHSAAGLASLDWVFQRSFEQLAERGCRLGESPNFWAMAWAWVRRVLGDGDRDADVPVVSSFPREWLSHRGRSVPAGPTRPLVFLSGPLFESVSTT